MTFKKSGGILCEESRLEAYRFTQQYNEEFGLRLLLNTFDISPNSYYNYLKNRKSQYLCKKDEIKSITAETYHAHDGVNVYRTMQAYLVRKGHKLSALTTHKYMNTELRLFSISRKRKPRYEHGTAHKIYENRFAQDFTADEINVKPVHRFYIPFFEGADIFLDNLSG